MAVPRDKSGGKKFGVLDLNATVAEKVFGWKDVRNVAGRLVGKKPDKLGRWRATKVPDYARDASQGFAIDEQMAHLGKAARYAKELAKIAKTKDLPVEWATPDQKAKAAVKIMHLNF